MCVASEDLPRLSTPAFVAVVGLLLILWLQARVLLLRSQLARGGPGTTRLKLVRVLAAWPGTTWLLGALAGALLVIAFAA